MSEVLEAVSRASKRSSAAVHEEMKAGLYSLATIACLAPWVGIFGNGLGIINSFQGIDGEKTALMAAFANRLSQSFWPTAFGLAIGLMSLFFYRYLTARLEAFDLEMENASLDLLNHLSRIPGPFTFALATGQMFGEEPADKLRRDDKSLRRCRYLAAVALFVAFVAQLFYSASIPWIYIPLTFGVSCLPAYFLWIRFLRRKPGGMLALASVICACWNVAELVMGRHLP